MDRDTVSYNLDAFRTGSENTLEQALARLPGFEIQEGDHKLQRTSNPCHFHSQRLCLGWRVGGRPQGSYGL